MKVKEKMVRDARLKKNLSQGQIADFLTISQPEERYIIGILSFRVFF